MVDCVVYYPFSVGAGALVGGFPRREGRGMGNAWKEKKNARVTGRRVISLVGGQGMWYVLLAGQRRFFEYVGKESDELGFGDPRLYPSPLGRVDANLQSFAFAWAFWVARSAAYSAAGRVMIHGQSPQSSPR